MRKAFLLVVVMLLLSSVVVGQQKTAGSVADANMQSDVRTITRLMQSWSKAVVDHDVKTLESILADDFTIIDYDGGRGTKFLCTAEVGRRATDLKSATPEDIEVKVYGDWAIVTLRLVAQGKMKDTAYTGPEMVTVVMVKRAGRWQALRSHGTRISRQK